MRAEIPPYISTLFNLDVMKDAGGLQVKGEKESHQFPSDWQNVKGPSD